MPTTKTNKSLGLLALAGLTPYDADSVEEYMKERGIEIE